MNYPSNIWLLVTNNEVMMHLATGGKIIYIGEELPTELVGHPSVVTAGVLLPPIESIQAEIDGRYDIAEDIYNKYLQSSSPSQYLNIILAAAIRNIKIGILFGEDEDNFKFPDVFVNYLYRMYGIVLGLTNMDGYFSSVIPSIEEGFIPGDLAILYMSGIIDSEEFIMRTPVGHLDYNAVYRLLAELTPVLDPNDPDYYIQATRYLNNYISQCKSSGKILVDPLVGDYAS